MPIAPSMFLLYPVFVKMSINRVKPICNCPLGLLFFLNICYHIITIHSEVKDYENAQKTLGSPGT